MQDRQLSIWVGIDASVKRDRTAIVCLHAGIAERKQVRVINHRIFQPSPDQPLDFELPFEHTLLALKAALQRAPRSGYDPYQMQASAQRLKREGIKIEEFPQSVPNLTEASQNLYELIQGRNLVVYPDDNDAPRHQSSHRRRDRARLAHREGKAGHKIDVVVAMGMACLAAVKNLSSYDGSGAWIRGPARSKTTPQSSRRVAIVCVSCCSTARKYHELVR